MPFRLMPKAAANPKNKPQEQNVKAVAVNAGLIKLNDVDIRIAYHFQEHLCAEISKALAGKPIQKIHVAGLNSEPISVANEVLDLFFNLDVHPDGLTEVLLRRLHADTVLNDQSLQRLASTS